MQFERQRPGCLTYFLAYCLACYGLSVVAFTPSDASVNRWWVLLAPLSVPALCLFGTLLIGNSELPLNTADLVLPFGIFVALFVAAVLLLRECTVRPRLAYSVAMVLAVYLVFAAVWLSG
jgi:hypothetical protein